MAVIELRKVVKRFGTTEVLRSIDLTVPHGKLTVLLGPSGCGKSTMLRVIAGLEDITSGDIEIDGKNVNDLGPKERGCAMVFQNYALYPHKSVFDNLAFPLAMERTDRGIIAQKVRETARQLHIEELLERRPRELSGGQRQRVAMGRAMIRKPQFFLFDEPLSNLDAELRVRMRLEIARLQKDLQTTMVFVTHDQVEAMTLAHTIVVMSNGTIQQIGSPLAVYRNPENQFVASFIGSPSMNFLDVAAATTDGGVTRMTLRGGQPITVPRILADKPVTLGIRPEHVEFDSRLPDNRVSAVAGEYKMIGVEQLGDRSYAHFALPPGELTILTPVEHQFRAGEPFVVRFPPDRIHVFAAGGRAI